MYIRSQINIGRAKARARNLHQTTFRYNYIHACAFVSLIDGLGYLLDSLVVSSLRVCDRLATLLDSMKESILALCCNFCFRQSTQRKRICRGFHAITLERSTLTKFALNCSVLLFCCLVARAGHMAWQPRRATPSRGRCCACAPRVHLYVYQLTDVRKRMMCPSDLSSYFTPPTDL